MVLELSSIQSTQPVAKIKVVDSLAVGDLPDTVRAALVVDEDDYDVIQFARTSLKGDILTITLYGNNGAHYHNFELIVSKGRYKVKYNLRSTVIPDEKSGVTPYETELILSTSEFKPGGVLKGFISFKGKCHSCVDDELLTVRGTFEVLIR